MLGNGPGRELIRLLIVLCRATGVLGSSTIALSTAMAIAPRLMPVRYGIDVSGAWHGGLVVIAWRQLGLWGLRVILGRRTVLRILLPGFLDCIGENDGFDDAHCG